jgi:hypothetical protein
VEFSADELKRMKVDVRARVLWAEEVEAIRADWIGKGAPAQPLREALDAAVLERNRHFRAKGIRDVIVAAVCFAVGLVSAYEWIAVISHQTHVSLRNKSAIMATTLIGTIVGLILAARGVRRILRGGSEELGASNLDDSD